MNRFRSLHFSIMHKLIATISTRIFGNLTYTVRHGLNKGMRRKGGLGFLPLPSPENAETRFLRDLDLQDKVVYDIGAFEGQLSLFFAQRAQCVIAFEPNPRNYRRCLENVALNNARNITVLNRGLSDVSGMVELAYDSLMPGAGSAEGAIRQQITESVPDVRTVRVPVVALDEALPGPPPSLVKIDIEGMEYKALRGMELTLRRHRPCLYIELHGATAKEKTDISRSVIGFLETLGYEVYDVERACHIRLAALNHCPSHIYATAVRPS